MNSQGAPAGTVATAPALQRLESFDTPLVAVDLDRAERNITRLQAHLDAHGIANRPHIKTHKLPFLAHRQVAAGAVGITVQTLGEAEVMVAAGIRDLLITYNLIGERKAERLAQLARSADISVGLDNEVALATVASAAARAGRAIGVLVEFESGQGRQGVIEPGEALALAIQVEKAQGLRFEGLMTYPCPPGVAEWLAAAKAAFGQAGITIPKVSVGGTPGAFRSHEVAGVTELRAGTYVYNDRKSVAAGAAGLDDCALHVHATVVSRPTADRCVIDTGSKSLTSDPVPPSIGSGFGHVLSYPEAVISTLSEEHAVVDLRACGSARPVVGERLRIVPNHVCPVSNLVDEVVLHRDGWVEATMPVAARGKH